MPPPRLLNRASQSARIVLGAAAVLLIAWLALLTAQWWNSEQQLPVNAVAISDDGRSLVTPGSVCGGHGLIVEEASRQVTVELFEGRGSLLGHVLMSTPWVSSGQCAMLEPPSHQLDEPLDGRRVVDRTTGHEVEVVTCPSDDCPGLSPAA